MPLGRDLIAKQHRDRNVVRAPERPQREGERGETGHTIDSTSTPGNSAGVTGNGMSAPNAQTMTNGNAAPSAAPRQVANSATSMISAQ